MLIFQGCTKEVPVGPVYTGENDWAPDFKIDFNNYQRISGTIEKVPRLSLLRNIDSCVVQARLNTVSSFTTVGSVAVPSPVSTGAFQTHAVFQMSQSYVIRLATFYRDGVVRYSRDTTIISPIVHGKVVKSISISSQIWDLYYLFWFNKGAIICYGSPSGWWMADTSNGAFQNIPTQSSFPSSSRFIMNGPVALSGDTAYFQPTGYTWWTGFNLLRYDLSTGWVDSSLILRWPSGIPTRVAVNGRKIAVTWDASSEGLHTTFLVEYDAITREVIDSCEISSETSPWQFYSLAYVGDDVWVSYPGVGGSNRVGRIDFSAGQIVESYENPVFDSEGLAWDGSNFWILNYSTSSYDKLLLESD